MSIAALDRFFAVGGSGDYFGMVLGLSKFEDADCSKIVLALIIAELADEFKDAPADPSLETVIRAAAEGFFVRWDMIEASNLDKAVTYCGKRVIALLTLRELERLAPEPESESPDGSAAQPCAEACATAVPSDVSEPPVCPDKID